MAVFIFHPANHADRRADGIGFVLAEGTDEASARASAAAMIGAPGIDAWSAVPVGANSSSSTRSPSRACRSASPATPPGPTGRAPTAR